MSLKAEQFVEIEVGIVRIARLSTNTNLSVLVGVLDHFDIFTISQYTHKMIQTVNFIVVHEFQP